MSGAQMITPRAVQNKQECASLLPLAQQRGIHRRWAAGAAAEHLCQVEVNVWMVIVVCCESDRKGIRKWKLGWKLLHVACSSLIAGKFYWLPKKGCTRVVPGLNP